MLARRGYSLGTHVGVVLGEEEKKEDGKHDGNISLSQSDSFDIDSFLVHPSGLMSTASIIHLIPDLKEKKDALFVSGFKNTKREYSSIKTRKKLHLMTTSGLRETFEFPE
jgi:hypothetical protein